MEARHGMKDTPYGRDVILILIASFFYMICVMLVNPLITGFSGELGASAAMMGLVGGLTNICSLFCRPLVGNLADMVCKYKLSLLGAILMAASCAAYFLAFHPFVVILARLVNGVGYACCSVCLSTWMSNLLPREKIGSGMGLYGTMNALSAAVAPAVGVAVYERLGYRVVFAMATISVSITAVILQFVRDRGLPVRQPGGSGRLEVAEPRAIPVALIIMLFTIPYCATQSFLVSYLEAAAPALSASLFFPAYAAMLLLLRLSLRSQFDRRPFSFFMLLCSLSALLAIWLLAWAESYPILILAAVFMAGGYGLMCSVSQSTAILLAGPDRRGVANGTYYIGLDLGMALGPILGGVLYGGVPISAFYPILSLAVPAGLLVFWFSRRILAGARAE